jgi:hypothetical protein
MPKLKRRLKAKPIRRTGSSHPGKGSSQVSPALRGKSLERAVERFQAEPDQKNARSQWKRIESSVFGVEFED